MYYKFNTMVNRIIPATQSEAYVPQGLRPLAKEPSKIIFESSKIQPVHEPEVTMTRPASSSAAAPKVGGAAALKEALGVVPNNARYQKIMQLQNFFLKDDGKLVWQKMGHDRAAYYATVGLCVLGTGLMVGQLFKMAFPPKSQD